MEAWNARACELFNDVALQEFAQRETTVKHIEADELQQQLTHPHKNWRALRLRLQEQVIPLDSLRSMLSAVGAPIDSSDIGITPQRLGASFYKAQMIRRRFTVLDLAARTNLMTSYVEGLISRD